MACLSDFSMPVVRDRPVPSLRNNFSWTLVGNLVYAACQWGMISVLAKLGSAAIVGQFALGLAVAAPVFMFTNLQLRGIQATDAHSQYEFADYFTLRCLATTAGLAAVVCVMVVSRYDRSTCSVILLVAIAKAVESLSDCTSGLLQKYERLDQVAVGFMIRGVLSLLIFAAAFWYFHSVIASVVGLVVAWSTVVIAYDFRRARRLLGVGDRFLRINPARLRALAVLSFPLGLVMALISLNVNLPRYILEHKLGAADLGIFASLAYMVTAVNMVIGALGQSATARLARMFATGQLRDFRLLLAKLIGFGASICILGAPLAACFGRPIITFLYRPEYADHIAVFVIMVAAAGVNAMGSFLGYGVTAARLFKPQVPVLVAVVATTFGFALLLVPRYGLAGAATALLVSSGVQVIGCAFVLRHALNS